MLVPCNIQVLGSPRDISLLDLRRDPRNLQLCAPVVQGCEDIGLLRAFAGHKVNFFGYARDTVVQQRLGIEIRVAFFLVRGWESGFVSVRTFLLLASPV